jgi:hypothetical protein
MRWRGPPKATAQVPHRYCLQFQTNCQNSRRDSTLICRYRNQYRGDTRYKPDIASGPTYSIKRLFADPHTDLPEAESSPQKIRQPEVNGILPSAFWQSIEKTEALFHSRHHQISDIVALDPLRCRDMAHDPLVAAIENKGDTNVFRIGGGDFKVTGAPAKVRLFDSDATLMPRFCLATCASPKEKAKFLHDPVDRLVVWRRASDLRLNMAHTRVFIRHLGDHRLDLGQQRLLG